MGALIRNLLPTLAAKIAGGLVIALLLALAVSRMQLGAAHDREAELNRAIGILNQAIGVLRTNQANLMGEIATQNARLADVQSASQTRIADLQGRLSRTSQAERTAREQANAILSRRPGADQCQSALDLMRGN